MIEKKYKQDDSLQNLIDWESIMKMPRYAGGHDDQMKGLITGAKVVGHWNERDYQGMVATCIQIPDGRFAIYNDYYGSCSGCDAWEDSTDEEVKNMCINLANGAYVFNSLEDVKEFLLSIETNTGWSSWSNCNISLLEEINK